MTPRSGSQAGGTRDGEPTTSSEGRTRQARPVVTRELKPLPVRMAIQGNIDPLSQFPSEISLITQAESAQATRTRVMLTPSVSGGDYGAVRNDAIAAIGRFDDIAGQMMAWLDEASRVRDELQRHLHRLDASSPVMRVSSVEAPGQRSDSRVETAVHVGLTSVMSSSTSMTVAVVEHRVVGTNVDTNTVAAQAAAKMMQLGSRLSLGPIRALAQWPVKALAAPELSRPFRSWRSGLKRIGPSTRIIGGVALLALLSLRAGGSPDPAPQVEVAPPVRLAEAEPVVAPPPQPALLAVPAARLIQASAKALSKVETPQLVEAARPREYFGTLAVASDPIGARVLVDGNYVGDTPLEVPQLRSGSHVIWIEAAGFVRWTGAYSVPANRRTAIHPKLQPQSDR